MILVASPKIRQSGEIDSPNQDQTTRFRVMQISEFPFSFEGGVSRVGRRYAAAFSANGWRVKNISAWDFTALAQPTGKRVVRMKVLKQFLASSGHDIFVLHGTASFFVIQMLSLLRQMRRPIVLVPYFHPFERNRFPLLGWLFFRFYTAPLLSGVTCLCLSRREETFFAREGARPVRIAIGHDYDFETGHLPGRYILFVGRTDKNKGWRHLAAAVTDLPVRAVVDRAAECGSNVEFLQGVSDVELRSLYRDALCTAVPSCYESFSLAALESLASGTPVIVSTGVQLGEEIPAGCKREVVFGDEAGLKSAVAEWHGMSAESEYMKRSDEAVLWAKNYRWSQVLAPVCHLVRQVAGDVKK